MTFCCDVHGLGSWELRGALTHLLIAKQTRGGKKKKSTKMAERHKARQRRGGIIYKARRDEDGGTLIRAGHTVGDRSGRNERCGFHSGYGGVWTQRQAQRVGCWVEERGAEGCIEECGYKGHVTKMEACPTRGGVIWQMLPRLWAQKIFPRAIQTTMHCAYCHV